MASKCPLCGGDGQKVIYAGFPGRICTNEECSCLWGAAAFVSEIIGWNGVLFAYDGSYLSALWRWLFASPPNEDE